MADTKKDAEKASEESGSPEEQVIADPAESGVNAAAPPGWSKGMNWNSDDARRAYEAAGTTLEAEQRKAAPSPAALAERAEDASE